MSDIIAKEAQDLSMDSDEGLIFLFELDFAGTVHRFHSESTDQDIRFGPEIGQDATTNTYAAFPMGIEGLEVTSEGSQPRPTLIIPNVTSLFRSDSSIPLINMEDLIGARVTIRKTLTKYVTIGSGDAPTNNYQFPKSIYIIDRLASKNSLAVMFELASPFDLAGVRVPSRQVTGKYCPWYYKGYSDTSTDIRSACSWDSTIARFGISSFDLASVDTILEFDGTAGTYTGVSDASLTRTIPATVNITTTGSGASTQVSSIQVTNPGNVYFVGDRLTFGGEDLGGTKGDLTINVQTIARTEVTLFFTIDDEPLIAHDHTDIVNSYVYTNSTFSINTIVKVGAGTVADPYVYFMAKADVPLNNAPFDGSIYWKAVRPFRIYNDDKVEGTPPIYYIYPEDPRKNSYVFHNNQVWRALRQHTASASIEPGLGSLFWTPADVCSKLLSGCKARYQAKVHKDYNPAGYSKVGDFNTAVSLPFGGFPGARKFR